MNDTPLRVQVNGEHQEVPPGTTVRALLDQLGLGGTLVAVEVNEEIVTRADHATHPVSSGDAIEIVQFVGGG